MCDDRLYHLDNIFIRFGFKRNNKDKLYAFNWLPFYADLFRFVMRYISSCLYQTIIKMILLKLLTTSPDIQMTYLMLIIHF